MLNKKRLYEGTGGTRPIQEGVVRLNSSLRQTINRDLVKSGFDGNKRWDSISRGLDKAGEILDSHGFEFEDILNAHLFMGDDGSRLLAIAQTNVGNTSDPYSVTNSALHLAWHKHDEGTFELIAYLS